MIMSTIEENVVVTIDSTNSRHVSSISDTDTLKKRKNKPKRPHQAVQT